MEGFIIGVAVAVVLMAALRGGRREQRTIYIPVPAEALRREQYDGEGGGAGWVGAIPFVVILIVLYQALAGA